MAIQATTLILVGVFVYFAIGALIAGSMTAVSMGFTGKFEPMAILVFFLWPAFYLLQIPYLLLALACIAAACGMTWLAYLAISALS